MKPIDDIVKEIAHAAAVCVEDHRHGTPCWKIVIADALKAERAEAERLKSELEKLNTCVVCGSELLPHDGPPHCLDCHVPDELLESQPQQ